MRLFGDLVVARVLRGREGKRARGEARASSRARSLTGDAGALSRGCVEERREARAAARAVSLGDRVPGGVRTASARASTRSSATRRSPGKNTLVERQPGRLSSTGSSTIHEGAHGNADLVAHFFRRAFDLLRDGGTFGLIATNTIAPGRHALDRAALDLHARRRDLRRAQASEVAGAGGGSSSASCMSRRDRAAARRVLDGRAVDTITAFLFHRGGHDDPVRLAANAGKSFQGSIVLGMGFTFDDTDKKGVATPLAEMHRLLAEDPRNAEAIFPYIGGEEVNNSPTHAHHRYVINFGDRERGRVPAALARVDGDRRGEGEAERTADNRTQLSSDDWWQFAEKRQRTPSGDRGPRAVSS